MASTRRVKTLTVSDEVRDVLSRSTFTETSVVLPDEQLPRPLYDAVAKVLDAAGGKWNRKARAHLFPKGTDPRKVFAEALESGTIVREQQTYQAFYTPEAVAQLLVRRARIQSDHSVLEPSAGDGALVHAILQYAPRNVMVVELNPRAVIGLRERFRHPSVHFAEGDFLRFIPHVGFAKVPPNGLLLHDRVVMNPPFNAGQDRAHIRHAFNFLKPGGRLVSIAPASFLSASEGGSGPAYTHELRHWLERNTEDRLIEELPPKSFAQAGTNIDTVMFSCTYKPVTV